MSRASFSLVFSLSVITVAFSGCGGGIDFKTVPASGIVTLDGKPVAGAGVTFMSKEGNKVASADTDADGKFALKTMVGKQSVNGAVVGVHKVGVSKTESSGPDAGKKEGETDKEMVNRMSGQATNTSEFKEKYIVPKRYNSPENSQITATVAEGGSTDIEIKLTSK